MAGKLWTDDEDALLIDWKDHQGKTFIEIGERLGREPTACASRLKRLTHLRTVPSSTRWKKEDVDRLVEWKARGIPMSEIAEKLGRTVPACYDKYNSLVHIEMIAPPTKTKLKHIPQISTEEDPLDSDPTSRYMSRRYEIIQEDDVNEW